MVNFIKSFLRKLFGGIGEITVFGETVKFVYISNSIDKEIMIPRLDGYCVLAIPFECFRNFHDASHIMDVIRHTVEVAVKLHSPYIPEFPHAIKYGNDSNEYQKIVKESFKDVASTKLFYFLYYFPFSILIGLYYVTKLLGIIWNIPSNCNSYLRMYSFIRKPREMKFTMEERLILFTILNKKYAGKEVSESFKDLMLELLCVGETYEDRVNNPIFNGRCIHQATKHPHYWENFVPFSVRELAKVNPQTKQKISDMASRIRKFSVMRLMILHEVLFAKLIQEMIDPKESTFVYRTLHASGNVYDRLTVVEVLMNLNQNEIDHIIHNQK